MRPLGRDHSMKRARERVIFTNCDTSKKPTSEHFDALPTPASPALSMVWCLYFIQTEI